MEGLSEAERLRRMAERSVGRVPATLTRMIEAHREPPTDEEIDAFFGPSRLKTPARRARREPEQQLDLTRDALIEASLAWAGAEGVPVGGPSYAALRAAIHNYKAAHDER